MSATHDTYTRRQGLKKTYDVDYTALHYTISLDGRVLKDIALSPRAAPATGPDATWRHAISDIEHLRGMPET